MNNMASTSTGRGQRGNESISPRAGRILSPEQETKFLKLTLQERKALLDRPLVENYTYIPKNVYPAAKRPGVMGKSQPEALIRDVKSRPMGVENIEWPKKMKPMVSKRDDLISGMIQRVCGQRSCKHHHHVAPSELNQAFYIPDSNYSLDFESGSSEQSWNQSSAMGSTTADEDDEGSIISPRERDWSTGNPVSELSQLVVEETEDVDIAVELESPSVQIPQQQTQVTLSDVPAQIAPDAAAKIMYLEEMGVSLTSPPRQLFKSLFSMDVEEYPRQTYRSSFAMDMEAYRRTSMQSPRESVDSQDFPFPGPSHEEAEESSAIVAKFFPEVADVGKVLQFGDSDIMSRGPVKAKETCKAARVSRVRLRGSKLPTWFPGYFFALPSSSGAIELTRTPSRVLAQAWAVVQPSVFPLLLIEQDLEV